MIGIPVAWMLASHGDEATINFFLQKLRLQSPTISPGWFMTDRDLAQINAIKHQYPNTNVVLCWWHVLHAWQQHFVVHAHPELWVLLKEWIRIDTVEGFKVQWEKIKGVAPQSVIQYLEEYWMPEKYQKMWSACARKGRDIFEKNDTNMLLEA